MISVQEIILRLLLGALIGGIIGFEREIHGRAAGFRTQLIVCVASVLIMIISENYYYKLQPLDSTLRILRVGSLYEASLQLLPSGSFPLSA
jgi:uncharacterized membrane protein YhiD involved in acid resistance